MKVRSSRAASRQLELPYPARRVKTPPRQFALPHIPPRFLAGPNPLSGQHLNLARDRVEALDRVLCPAATRTTRGRMYNDIREDNLRTQFQRDIQRIENSTLFLRLQHKTQVFPHPDDPGVRNRHTHSREVARLARSMAEALRLNPDLAEAIGLGHDVGHSPFGHAGESILDKLRQKHCGLYHKHNLFGLALIDDLFINEDTGERLDLTFEVRDGAACHLGETSEREIIPYGSFAGEKPKDITLKELKRGDVAILEKHRLFFPSTLEGCVARFADRFSSVARDPENAVQHGIISWQNIPRISQKVFTHKGLLNASTIIKTLVESLILHSWNPTDQNVYSIKLGDKEAEALKALQDFNFNKIYRHPEVVHYMLLQVPTIIEALFADFHQQMTAQEAINLIAYLTDREALEKSGIEHKPIV